MSVTLDDHWYDDPVWAPLFGKRVHGAAFLLHTAARSWLSYHRRETIPEGSWRHLHGWTKRVENALVGAGLVAMDGDGSARLVADGRPRKWQEEEVSEATAPALDRSAINAANARAGWEKRRSRTASQPPPGPDANECDSHLSHDAIASDSQSDLQCDSHPLPPRPSLPSHSISISKERANARDSHDANECDSHLASRIEYEPDEVPSEEPDPSEPPAKDPNRVTRGEAIRLFGGLYVKRRAALGRPVDGYHQFGRYTPAFEDIVRVANKSKTPRETLQRGISNYLATNEPWVIDKDFPVSTLATQWNRWVDPPKERSEREYLLKHGMALVSDFSHVKPMPPPDEEEKKRLREFGVAI